MSENILNFNYWYFVIFIYLFIGFLLSKGVIGNISRLMSVIGWPIELAQRLSGTKSLPYLFLFPNILIFGLFTLPFGGWLVPSSYDLGLLILIGLFDFNSSIFSSEIYPLKRGLSVYKIGLL